MKTHLLAALGAVAICLASVGRTWPENADSGVAGTATLPAAYAAPHKRCDLVNPQIRESSGLAASRLRPDVLWTHNDSGDTARLFAVDLNGNDLGVYDVDGARADDWEDMASFWLDGRSCLLVGDVGNNRASRPTGTLYLVEEPRIGQSRPARLLCTVRFRFEDGPYDCEAIGFDAARREVLLATKQIGLSARVYVLAWPASPAAEPLVARHVATIAVPIATAMDISPDGLRAVVLSYGHAYQFVRDPDEDWQSALARPGQTITMPWRGQGESICLGNDGVTLFLTSEQQPTPLWEVPGRENP